MLSNYNNNIKGRKDCFSSSANGVYNKKILLSHPAPFSGLGQILPCPRDPPAVTKGVTQGQPHCWALLVCLGGCFSSTMIH